MGRVVLTPVSQSRSNVGKTIVRNIERDCVLVLLKAGNKMPTVKAFMAGHFKILNFEEEYDATNESVWAMICKVSPEGS